MLKMYFESIRNIFKPMKDFRSYRSVNLRMKFWCLQISQKANQILDKFLPYEARAEICQKFGWLFERFEDTKNSF